MCDHAQKKEALRSSMRKRRAALPVATRLSERDAVTRRLLDLEELKAAEMVALFSPMGPEMDILPFARALEERGIRICVPVVLEKLLMEFVEVTYEQLAAPAQAQPDFLAKPALSCALPTDCRHVHESEIDLMVVPGLAFDPAGHRLGYGGGFYDSYLSRPGMDAPTVAPIYEMQLISEVPVAALDRTVDIIVTPAHVIRLER